MPAASDARATETFLSEARSLVEELQRGVETLHALARSGEVPPWRANALFRPVHTLKGIAAMVGLPELARLAHAVEDGLDPLRRGLAPIDRAALDALSEAAASLARALDEARRDHPEMRRNDLGRSDFDALSEYQSERLRARVDAGAALYRVVVRAPLDAAARATEAARAAAERVGEPIGWIPRAAGETELGLALLLATDREEAEVRRALSGAGDVERVTAAPVAHDAVPRAVDAIDALRAELQTLTERAAAPHFSDLVRIERDLGRALARLRHALGFAPLSRVFGRLAREAQRLARASGRSVRVDVEGEDTRVDARLADALVAPLVHLVRNALDHGIEAPAARVAAAKDPVGTLSLRARTDRDALVIEVEDDGAGVDLDAVRASAVAMGLVGPDASPQEAECLDLISRPGLSTRAVVGESSGRGVGLDAVRVRVGQLGGAVEIASARGRSTRVTLTIPAAARQGIVAAGDDTT